MMRYEKPELSLVEDAASVVLGAIDGFGDNAGTPPDELVSTGLVLGLDD